MGFGTVSKAMAGVGGLKRICKDVFCVGGLKRICKDVFCVAGAVHETHESDMLGGQGADFLSGLHFRASDRQVC